MTPNEFRKLRLAKGYSQSELARALGVATQSVSCGLSVYHLMGDFLKSASPSVTRHPGLIRPLQ
jgi:transcriptional regulator with XRE-family HTH domain